MGTQEKQALMDAIKSLEEHRDRCNKAFEKNLPETNISNYEKFKDDLATIKLYAESVRVEEYWERGMVTLEAEMRCRF